MVKKEKKIKEPSILKEQLRKLTILVLNNFNALIIFLVIVIIICGFLFVLKPKYNSVSDTLSISKEDKEAEKKLYKNYIEKLQEYKEDYSRISETDRQKIEKMIPPKEDVEDLFGIMESLVKKQGLVLLGLEVSDAGPLLKNKDKDEEFEQKENVPQLMKDVVSANIKLAVSGVDYNSFKRFLWAIEDNLRLMDVQTVYFSPNEGVVNIDLMTYFLEKNTNTK